VVFSALPKPRPAIYDEPIHIMLAICGQQMSDYRVKFEVFEGPLDLLLYLIRKEEVDIYEVNLTKLATQFIEYVELMRRLDLEIAGEFLVMASTLMYLKSKELLPTDLQAVPEGEEDNADPRWELIRRLVEYKKFKDAAAELQKLEIVQENTFTRVPGKVEIESPSVLRKGEVSIFELLDAVNAILKRLSERQETRDIFEDKWTVSDKIEFVRQKLTECATVKFSELFASATSRIEVVVTFLAILELVRLKVIVISQAEEFGEIIIALAPPAVLEPPATEPAVSPAELIVAPDVPQPKPATETQPSAIPTVVVEVQPNSTPTIPTHPQSS